MRVVNLSFVQVHDILKVNVRNNDFFLNTINPDVWLVSPYAEDISNDDRNIVIGEIKANVWYFFREILRTDEETLFQLTVNNLSMIYCALNYFDHYLIIPDSKEQEDDTKYSRAGFLLWELISGRHNNDIIINNPYAEGIKDFNTMKELIALLPQYLKCNFVISEDSIVYSESLQGCFLSEFAINKENVEDINNENSNNISVIGDFNNIPLNIEFIDTKKDMYNMVYSSNTTHQNYPHSIIRANYLIDESCIWRPIFFDLTIDGLREFLYDLSLSKFFAIKLHEVKE